MSHRIVINTELNNRVALEATLSANGWAYKSVGPDRIRIDDGPGAGGTVDLKTGRFHGDSDMHTPARMQGLLQAYGDTLWSDYFSSHNGYVESRTVLADGTIRLVGTVTEA